MPKTPREQHRGCVLGGRVRGCIVNVCSGRQRGNVVNVCSGRQGNYIVDGVGDVIRMLNILV